MLPETILWNLLQHLIYLFSLCTPYEDISTEAKCKQKLSSSWEPGRVRTISVSLLLCRQGTWSICAYTCWLNGLRGLHNPSWLPFDFGSQEPRSQVARTLVPWNWLGFPLSAPWSQPVGLTQLLERTYEVQDPCLGHKADGRCRETR